MRDIYSTYNNFSKYEQVKSRLIIEGCVREPELSIFIPTYKRTDMIKETIASAINQVGDVNFEIVIVSNDPEDDGGKLFETIKAFKNDKIYYYANDKNIGLSGNWNRGIELSRAKYVSMIHDDDILSPWFSSSIIKAISDNPDADILGVSFVNFSSSNPPQFHNPGNLSYRDVTKGSFFFGKYINIAGMTIKKDSALSMGGYSDDYYPNEDTILIYQTLLGGRVVNVEAVLAGYRQESNLSLNKATMEQIISITEYTRKQIASHEPFAKIWMRLFDREYLFAYVKGANSYWNTDIQYSDILAKIGMPEKPINPIKYFVMKGFLTMINRRYIK